MLKGKRILIVDDEVDLGEILKDEFDCHDAQTATAVNGQQAFALFGQFKPDVIISDVRMAGGDGISLLKNVRAVDHKIPFFLNSGFADTTVEDVFKLGADGFFAKPFLIEEIVSAVTRSLSDPKDKWSMRSPFAAKVSVFVSNWQQFAEGKVQWGRGGFRAEIPGVNIVAGDQVLISDMKNSAMQCSCKWARVGGGLPGVYGFEVLGITDDLRSSIGSGLGEAQVAFIP